MGDGNQQNLGLSINTRADLKALNTAKQRLVELNAEIEKLNKAGGRASKLRIDKIAGMAKTAGLEMQTTAGAKGKTQFQFQDVKTGEMLEQEKAVQRMLKSQHNFEKQVQAQSIKDAANTEKQKALEKRKYLKDWDNALAENDMRQEKSAKKSVNTSRKLRGGWALNLIGVMFMAQAAEKALTRLATTAISSFTSIAGPTNAAALSLLGFQVGIQAITAVLGEAIGTALMPFLDTFLNIVEVIINFIAENQALVGWLVLLGIAFFFVLAFATALLIAIAGIHGAIMTVVGAGLGPLLLAIGLAFLLVAVIIVAAVAMWIADIGGFRDFISNTFDIIFAIIKDVFKSIWLIIKHVWKGIMSFLNGDIDDMLGHFKLAFIEFLSLINKLGNGMALVMRNVLIWLVNSLKSVVIGMMKYTFNSLTDWIRDLHDLMGEFSPFGAIIKGLDKVNKAMEKAKEYKIGYYGIDDYNEYIAAGEKSLDVFRNNIKLSEQAAKTPMLEDENDISAEETSFLDKLSAIGANTTVNIIQNISGTGSKELKEIVEQANKTTLNEASLYNTTSTNIGN